MNKQKKEMKEMTFIAQLDKTIMMYMSGLVVNTNDSAIIGQMMRLGLG